MCAHAPYSKYLLRPHGPGSGTDFTEAILSHHGPVAIMVLGTKQSGRRIVLAAGFVEVGAKSNALSRILVSCRMLPVCSLPGLVYSDA